MSEPFTLIAALKTNFWRKLPSIDSANAPMQLMSVDSRTFKRVRVTVRAHWERLYDQGGLFVIFPGPSSGAADAGDAGGDGGHTSIAGCFLLKAGIEFYYGRSNISIVASREWSNWSSTLQPPSSLHAPEPGITIELELEAVDAAAGTGLSLFVHVVHDKVQDEVPIREMMWAFEHNGLMRVGTYAARPTAVRERDEKQLEVHFEGFEYE